ncbi:MAG: hypothetical protein ACQEXJ_09495 [Myxococcota bacterium]
MPRRTPARPDLGLTLASCLLLAACATGQPPTESAPEASAEEEEPSGSHVLVAAGTRLYRTASGHEVGLVVGDAPVPMRVVGEAGDRLELRTTVERGAHCFAPIDDLDHVDLTVFAPRSHILEVNREAVDRAIRERLDVRVLPGAAFTREDDGDLWLRTRRGPLRVRDVEPGRRYDPAPFPAKPDSWLIEEDRLNGLLAKLGHPTRMYHTDGRPVLAMRAFEPVARTGDVLTLQDTCVVARWRFEGGEPPGRPGHPMNILDMAVKEGDVAVAEGAAVWWEDGTPAGHVTEAFHIRRAHRRAPETGRVCATFAEEADTPAVLCFEPPDYSGGDVSCDMPSGGVDLDAGPTVALVVEKHGPLLPSEWREVVLPAARRTFAEAHPDWDILDADDMRRLRRDLEAHRATCGADFPPGALLRQRDPNSVVVRLLATCLSDCTLGFFSDEGGFGGTWRPPASPNPHDWARVVSKPWSGPVGFGGGGARGFAMRHAVGSWEPEEANAARQRLRSIPWPEACRHAKWTSVLLDVAPSGEVAEIVVDQDGHEVSECLRRALRERLSGTPFPAGEGTRRILATWEPPGRYDRTPDDLGR